MSASAAASGTYSLRISGAWTGADALVKLSALRLIQAKGWAQSLNMVRGKAERRRRTAGLLCCLNKSVREAASSGVLDPSTARPSSNSPSMVYAMKCMIHLQIPMNWGTTSGRSRVLSRCPCIRVMDVRIWVTYLMLRMIQAILLLRSRSTGEVRPRRCMEERVLTKKGERPRSIR